MNTKVKEFFERNNIDYFEQDGKIFAATKDMTAQQRYEQYLNDKQIDICPEPKSKTLEELTKENEQLWETVQFLLKKTGMIGDEKNEIL